MAKGHRSQIKRERNANKDTRPSAKLSYARVSVQKACFVLDAIRLSAASIVRLAHREAEDNALFQGRLVTWALCRRRTGIQTAQILSFIRFVRLVVIIFFTGFLYVLGEAHSLASSPEKGHCPPLPCNCV